MRGCSNASMILSHSRGSFNTSSSSSSITFNLLIPKLSDWRNGGLPESISIPSSPNAKLDCRLNPLVLTILPPLMHPSIVLRIFFNISPSSETIDTDGHCFFHIFAVSSSTPSARPSFFHPEPQCLPMKVDKATSAGVWSVKLYLRVNIRKAAGRRMAGGSETGRTVLGLKAGACMGFGGIIGCSGVANAGLEEGIAGSERR